MLQSLGSFSFVFWVVLLENIILLKSQFTYRLQQVFFCNSVIYPYFAAFIVTSTFASLPGPAAYEHPHGMMPPPPGFMVGIVPFW